MCNLICRRSKQLQVCVCVYSWNKKKNEYNIHPEKMMCDCA